MSYHRTILLLALSGCSLIVNPKGGFSEEEIDATRPPMDAQADTSPPNDSGERGDAGARDTGTLDAGEHDTGTLDAGEHDTGTLDAGARDTGTLDAGARDTGTLDAGDPCRGALTGDAGPIGFCRVAPIDWRGVCPSGCDMGCWGTWHDAGMNGALLKCE